MTVKSSPLHVFLLAGVKTTTCAFNVCKEKLETQLRSEGVEPIVQVLFPYGDNTRNVVRQVLEVRSDLSNRMKAGRVGGRKVWEQLKESVKDEEGRFLLIGHSGGGAAAYQAARLLEENGLIGDFRVVQVGSPRMPIHPRLQDKVSYFHSVDSTGRMNDPITKIGTWGGWTRKGRSVPRWSRYKYAPGYVEGIPVVGGHADYFRHAEPYVDKELVCNLDKTISRVGAWLKGWL